ncbi:cytochrome P450 [uncultured Flavobacterium sp.]|uniref:cytochrome P450 n=1 Tax=uncultured Flavobacterium sp. TaxID=165435 RepID=UPI0030EC4749|tara:strand:- start:38013 stop:39347 length:1335 start_codon:yes stop_codon:yes gene_type:complete
MSLPNKIPEVSFFRFLNHANNILKNPLPFHAANFNKLGDVFRLNIGLGKSVLFCRDASLLQHALQKNQKNYTKSKIQTKDLAKYVGKGLLTAEGEHWKKQRKLIQPAFHKSQLVLLLDTIQQTILTELKNIKTGKPIDIFPVFNDLAFQTVVKSIFNIDISNSDISSLQNTTEATQNMLVQELRQPFLVWWFNLSGKTKKHLDLTQNSRSILKRLVEERKQSKAKHDDLLEMLLNARYEDGSSMDENQLVDEILILFAAGHETTSNALTFICELLARNPDSQLKILEEIRNVKSESNEIMYWIKNANYTKLVIEESMRLYPPAYFIDRVNIEEENFNGLTLPKGSNLLFSVYEIHRHPDFWNSPLEFIPERFLDEKIKFSNNYFPFGAGPRMCIGNNFAMYEMILSIIALVEQFEIIEKREPIQIKPLITLKPFNAILEFKNRI